jgi:uncharacterized phage-associated protein
MEALNSPQEKLQLLAWLEHNDFRSFSNTRKVQKFIFFYEAFLMTLGEPFEMGDFKIWLHGPVDSVVYGDYTYRQPSLFNTLHGIEEFPLVNKEVAKKANFLVQILTTTEISELSHELDFWKVKGQKCQEDGTWHTNVQADAEDFSDTDLKMLSDLYNMYSDEMIDNVVVIHSLGGKHFVLTKEDYDKLSIENQQTLDEISTDEFLMNPVFVSVDSDGGLLID